MNRVQPLVCNPNRPTDRYSCDLPNCVSKALRRGLPACMRPYYHSLRVHVYYSRAHKQPCILYLRVRVRVHVRIVEVK